jgi:uncharacterized membrane protein (UPF0136 family)
MESYIILISYAAFLIMGGFVGMQKGSKVSMVLGLISGILFFWGLWIMTFAPQVAWIFLSCLNVVLSLIFIVRFIKTRVFMPSGMLLLVTLAILIFCVTHLSTSLAHPS